MSKLITVMRTLGTLSRRGFVMILLEERRKGVLTIKAITTSMAS